LIVYVEPGFGAFDEILEIKVSKGDTISLLKKVICEELGIKRPEELIMVFDGKELDTSSTIGECGIYEYATIGLMPETRGGLLTPDRWRERVRIEARLMRDKRRFRHHLWRSMNPPEDTVWRGRVKVKEGLYAGKYFEVELRITREFPIYPPEVVFLDDIFHPNISSIRSIGKGHVCAEILKSKWTPSTHITAIPMLIEYLLVNPNPDDPLDKIPECLEAARWVKKQGKTS
jgi:ubiquitin-protein ligase